MGYEAELRQLKEEHDSRYLNAGSVRKKMLLDVADFYARRFKAQCRDAAKAGHEFADVTVGCIPVTDEEIKRVRTLIKKNLKCALDKNIRKFDNADMVLATSYVLPHEAKFFLNALEAAIKKMEIENAVVRCVSIFRDEEKNEKAGRTGSVRPADGSFGSASNAGEISTPACCWRCNRPRLRRRSCRCRTGCRRSRRWSGNHTPRS